MPDRHSDETFVFGEAYEVTGRSTVLFALQPGPLQPPLAAVDRSGAGALT